MLFSFSKMATPSKTERKLSRSILESHGIFYDPKLYCFRDITLPDHVDAVKEMLLSFEKILPDGSWKIFLEQELQQYGSDEFNHESLQPQASSWITSKVYETEFKPPNGERKIAHKNLLHCEKIAVKARRLDTSSENSWEKFWRETTFTHESEKSRERPGYQ